MNLRATHVAAGMLTICITAVVVLLHWPMGKAFAEQNNAKAPPPAAGSSPKALFETHCSACHSLELPRSQRLDRNTWRWVVDDMVNKFGATWITEDQQRKIIDYLVENYGPDRPRDRPYTN